MPLDALEDTVLNSKILTLRGGHEIFTGVKTTKLAQAERKR